MWFLPPWKAGRFARLPWLQMARSGSPLFAFACFVSVAAGLNMTCSKENPFCFRAQRFLPSESPNESEKSAAPLGADFSDYSDSVKTKPSEKSAFTSRTFRTSRTHYVSRHPRCFLACPFDSRLSTNASGPRAQVLWKGHKTRFFGRHHAPRQRQATGF